jgi:hypothetical protein
MAWLDAIPLVRRSHRQVTTVSVVARMRLRSAKTFVLLASEPKYSTADGYGDVGRSHHQMMLMPPSPEWIVEFLLLSPSLVEVRGCWWNSQSLEGLASVLAQIY